MVVTLNDSMVTSDSSLYSGKRGEIFGFIVSQTKMCAVDEVYIVQSSQQIDQNLRKC